ncbi:MAG TPA: O-antigen ligase family protein [Pseudomonas sp.]|jgi:O-antigen ligase|nr:O-antigen ligase family protein [Pseudomonas sp.]
MALIVPLALLLALTVAVLLAGPLPHVAPLLAPALIALGVLYRRPAWGILGLVAMIPIEGLFPEGSAITGGKLVGYTLILVVALQLLLRQLPEERLRSNLWKLLLPFLLCYGLSILYSRHIPLSLETLRQLSVGLSLFVLTLLLYKELDLLWLARLMVLGVSASGVIALDNIDTVTGRSVGLLSDPNYFALLLTTAIPPALLLALRSRLLLMRLFWLGLMLFLIYGLTKTDSRSGFLIFLLCLVGTLWHFRAYRDRVRPRHFGFILLALIIGAPLAFHALPDKYVERVKTLAFIKQGARSYDDPSLGRRTSYLIVGSGVIAKHPLLGSGPGTFPLEYAESGYAVAFSLSPNNPNLHRVAHNTYMGMLAEVGLPGGLLFIGLVLLGLKNFQHARVHWLTVGDDHRAQLAAFMGLTFLALCVFLLFLSIPNSKLLWILLAVSSGMRLEAETSPVPQTTLPETCRA